MRHKFSLPSLPGRSELSWLAGWLEGEGSFTVAGPTAVISATCTDQDTAARVAIMLNGKMSKVTHPDNRPEHYKQVYAIQITGQRALVWMIWLRPLMGLRRQDEIDTCLSVRPTKTAEARQSAQAIASSQASTLKQAMLSL